MTTRSPGEYARLILRVAGRSLRTGGPRAAGFTLVESMVVLVALVAVSVSASRYYSKGRRGEQAAAFARVMQTTFEQARQLSLLPGTTTRLRLVPPPTQQESFTLALDRRDINVAAGTWRPVSRLVAPRDMVICSPQLSSRPQGITGASCPMGDEQRLLFSNGQVRVADTSDAIVCPTGGLPFCPGVSLPFKTVDENKRWYVHLFGLTGMTRSHDRW